MDTTLVRRVRKKSAGVCLASVPGLLSRTAGMFIACLLAGCAFNEGKTRITHHVGYIKIVESEGSTAGVVSRSVRTVGVRVEDGIGVGYFDEKHIVVPLDCRLVIITQSQAQLDEALQYLENLQRKELCVAIEP